MTHPRAAAVNGAVGGPCDTGGFSGWCRLLAFSLLHPRQNITEEIHTP